MSQHPRGARRAAAHPSSRAGGPLARSPPARGSSSLFRHVGIARAPSADRRDRAHRIGRGCVVGTGRERGRSSSSYRARPGWAAPASRRRSSVCSGSDRAIRQQFPVPAIRRQRREVRRLGLAIMPSRARLSEKTAVAPGGRSGHGLLAGGLFAGPLYEIAATTTMRLSASKASLLWRRRMPASGARVEHRDEAPLGGQALDTPDVDPG
jgi:hypothetical protein